MNRNNSDIEDSEPGGKSVQAGHREFSWYAFLFGPPFRLIGFFYRTYRANRSRLADLASKPSVSTGLRNVMLLTLVLWIAIWLLASDESRNRLTNVVQENFGSLGAAFTD